MLKQAHIEGYKCLYDVTLELAPFMVLIGANDSGKSSFLQALSLVAGAHSIATRRLRDIALSQQVLISVRGERGTFATIAGGEPQPGWPPQADLEMTAQLEGNRRIVIAGRGPIGVVAGPLMLDPSAIAEDCEVGSGAIDKLVPGRGHGTAAHLARLALGDRQRHDAIQDALRDVTQGRVLEAIVSEPAGNKYALAFRLHDGRKLPASEMSQGLLMYLAFLALVHRDDAPSVLLVEEPENGLHPLRLHEVVTLLRTLTAGGVQIILTTHSPDLLSACRPEEVRVFLRPEPASGTEIRQLPKDFDRRAMRETLGQVWASRGEAGLLDILPHVEPTVRADPS